MSDSGLTIEDFWAYLPEHKYICAPTRDLWPVASVNARLAVPDALLKASEFLDERRAVEQMTWAPGELMLIEDRLVTSGGWIDRPGCKVFNLYRPPVCQAGNAELATPWLEQVNEIYPDEAEHIIDWLAHRTQHPEEKVNHALVLAGPQGIGKDSILQPAAHAVGPWNVQEVSPTHLLGRFNGFVKSVILRISEARDLGDIDRFAFYDRMKVYTAAPPDILRCDEKNIREYSVFNACGVVITSNHHDGLYLPSDDRRHFVAWSERTKEDFGPQHWNNLYRWYQQGGLDHVAAFLRERDLSLFDPKAPPRKTGAFWRMVDSNRSPEDAELEDAVERLKRPSAITLRDVADVAEESFKYWLLDRRNARQVPHRLEAAGYVAVRKPQSQQGLWVIGGKRQVIYARRDLSVRDRELAAMDRAR